MSAFRFLDELMAPYVVPIPGADAGPTSANPAKAANPKNPCGLQPDSGSCEGLRISAKPVCDSQTFASLRNPSNGPESQQARGFSQDSQRCPETSARLARLLRWGWPRLEAEATAERLARRKTGKALGDMVTCLDCLNLGSNGQCRAAATGELEGVWRRYSPAVDVYRRCECYVRRPANEADFQQKESRDGN